MTMGGTVAGKLGSKTAAAARAAGCAVLSLLVASCAPSVEWIVTTSDPDVAGATSLEARVRRGGCDGEIVYSATLPAAPPSGLEAGEWGFEAVARDACCRVVGEGCTRVTLPHDGSQIVVEVRSTGVSTPCTPEVSECVCEAGTCADAGRPMDAAVDAGDAGRPLDAGPPPDDAGPRDAGRDAGSSDSGCPGGCDDGVACTDDVCVGTTCMHTPVHARCDDGEPCTDDVCEPSGCATASRPDGESCGATTCDAWSACTYASECVESGSQSRECTDLACNGGACEATTRTETQTAPCARSTGGITCTRDGNRCTNDVCSGGACTHPALRDGSQCTTEGTTGSAFLCCAGTCRYTEEDDAHCGGCYVACGGGYGCNGGYCRTCLSDAECETNVGAGFFCRESTGRCDCTAGSCPRSWQFCNSMGRCRGTAP